MPDQFVCYLTWLLKKINSSTTMANNKLLVNERQADLGDFMVGRLLPFRKKRQVGPFTFIDHMGPAKLGAGKFIDVDQHPHIGLSTLTYLFEGEIEHRDSMGTTQLIRPGDVGFMTSGKGVTHTERTPLHLRDQAESWMHGYQIWVALPESLELMEPEFQFVSGKDLPLWYENGVRVKLVAGNAFGKQSPLQGYTPLFMMDVFAETASTLNLAGKVEGEIAFVIVNGSISVGSDEATAGSMLISKTEDQCSLNMAGGTQLLIFGGKPLDKEPRLLWNFVSASKERLQQAKEDWVNKRFPKVPGDETYIQFPDL